MQSLVKEIQLRSNFFIDKTQIETIYFGGGTPSLLSIREIEQILSTISANFNLSPELEICLEANPDDLSKDKLKQLKSLNINRLSIGVQSFDDDLLQWMNRSHNASQAEMSINEALEVGFEQISLDLIYGIPGLSLEGWTKDVKKVLSMPIQHLSSYSLTLEPKTAYDHNVRIKKAEPPSDLQAERDYLKLIELINKYGWEQYEVSNFCQRGNYSKHNTSYWRNIPYLGIGPSAHSYDGNVRYWNVSSNTKYIQEISKAVIPFEKEELSHADRVNEYLLTALRTKWGIDLEHLNAAYGHSLTKDQNSSIVGFTERGWMIKTGQHYYLSQEGLLFADYISSELFIDHSSQMSS